MKAKLPVDFSGAGGINFFENRLQSFLCMPLRTIRFSRSGDIMLFDKMPPIVYSSPVELHG